MSADLAPRNRLERALVALTGGFSVGGYTFPPWPAANVARLVELLRRARARGRRGKRTKAGRRARAMGFYGVAGACR